MGFATGAFYAVLGLVALAAGAVGVLILALPTDAVRERIVSEVKERTGHDLIIAGGTSFSLYPNAGVTLADVTLKAPAERDAPPIAKIAAIDVSVQLLPLISREVVIERLILREPVLDLVIDADGRKSWERLAEALRTPRVRLAQAEADNATQTDAEVPAAAAPRERRRIGKLSLANAGIENGTVRYRDERSGSRQEATRINARLSLAAIEQPLETAGDLVWRGETVKFDARLASLDALLDERPAMLKATASTAAAETHFDGTIASGGEFSADGAFTAKGQSLRDVLAWTGTELPPSEGFRAFGVTGTLRVGGTATTLSDARFDLDKSVGEGQIAIERGEARPLLRANLKISEVDLNLYKRSGSAAPAPSKAQEPGRTQGTDEPGSIDDLIEREAPEEPGPRVKGYTQRAGWSETPFDFSALGLVDAEAKLAIGKLRAGDLRLDRSDVTVGLKNSSLKATFDQIRAYDGQGHGFVSIDASEGEVASLGANFAFESVDVRPFLTDAAKLDWIAGRGKLTLALAGQGRNEAEVIRALNGEVQQTFTDGAIVGINIPALIRSGGTGGNGGEQATDFSRLTSRWNVANGVASNSDLALVSPLMRVSGSGSVSLAEREIDYTLKPKLVASLSGQGGEANLKGIEVPVKVAGSWEAPAFSADLKSLMENPDQAIDTLKEIGKQLKGKSANEIVEGLFGKGDESEGEKKPARKLLDQFLGR